MDSKKDLRVQIKLPKCAIPECSTTSEPCDFGHIANCLWTLVSLLPSRIVMRVKRIKWYFESVSQTSMMIKITWGHLLKPKVSQAHPLRPLHLLIQWGRPAPSPPGDSYHLGNTVWRHLAYSSLFSVILCALYVVLVSQEKQRKSRLKIQNQTSHHSMSGNFFQHLR